jgi:predicted transcriptional regulator
MSIETRKLKVIHWLSELKDETILAKIEQLKPSKKDWWEEITDQEKDEIQEGLSQADKDEVKTTEEVLAKYRKWDTK